MTKGNRSHRRKQRQDRRLVVRSVRHNPPDYRKLAGALIELAQAQTEADARAEDERKRAVRQRRGEHLEHENEGTRQDQARGGQL